MRVMTEEEYKKRLHDLDLTDQKLADFIFNKTGAIIKAKHIGDYLHRNGRLSEPMTAAIRFAVSEIERVTNEQRTS